ncbi:MAG: hypothetical protein CMN30_12480 [Sandaracinus sp.]|nr:hypothetical protein [Sandaracinus sp.]
MGSTGPYRAGGGRDDEVVAEGGIVDDLVKQFADPLAFYRELVQNAIDADTDEVVVTVQHAPGEPVVIAVTDRGSGMDPEILQEKLLVLFRSGKENDDSKIGKFGVGFISVLAMNPERVTVRTSRGEGKSHVLHLHRDHTYDLFETGGGQRSGTTVSLTLEAMAEDAVTDLVARSRVALERWCRFARTPIHLREVRQGEVVAEYRIDRALGFEAAEVQVTHVDGDTRVVVALPGADGPYAGFFNQGLLLHETRSSFGGRLSGLRFIVQDPRLEHTLSRDDVRRDGAFRRALRLVEKVVERELVPAALTRLGDLAESSPNGHAQLLARLVTVMPTLPLAPRDLVLRRLHAVDGKHGVRVRDAGRGLVCAARTGALTEAVARAGWVVVPNTMRRVLEQVGAEARDAHAAFTHVTPVETRLEDEALMARLVEHLDRAHRAPSAVALVTVDGAAAGRGYLAGDPPPAEGSVHEGKMAVDPFRLLRREGLLLDIGTPTVVAARAMAEADPEVAAALLARDVLVFFGHLDGGADDALTQGALAAVLGVTA